MRRWSLSDLALARPVTVGMLLIAIILLGAIATFRLPLAFLPAESVSQLRVSVNLSANSPEVLEREVIRPLEEAIAGVRDLERMRVSSGTWGVRANLEFRAGTDIDARKIELRERLDRARANLPADVQSIELVSSQGSADEPIMRVRIAGDDELDSQYYLIQQRVIRAIERIDGVARVEMEGLEPPELEVALDLDAARSHGIALADVNTAVRSAQRGRSLGTLRRTDTDTGVRSPGPPAEPEHFAALPVERGVAGQASTTGTATSTTATSTSTTSTSTTSTSTTTISAANNSALAGTPTPTSAGTLTTETTTASERDRHFARLGEVARVDLHPKEQRRGSRLNGRPAINLEVFADAGASPVEVSKAVREVVEGLHGDPALAGIEVAVFEDQGELILDTLGDLRDTGIYGGLIGMVVLFGFLHRWRTTLIASLCVPLSVLVACGVLFVRGAELDCIVLLGLVLGVGMLIDNAVVIVEAIEQRTQQGMSALEAAREGAREVGLATVASTMTSVIVFLPMIVGGGSSRMYTYMAPLGATFVTALVASLLVSQLAVPMLVAWRELGGREAAVARPPEPAKPVRNWVLEPLARGYARFIAWSIRHPRLILLVGLALCASAVYPAKNLQIDMGMEEKMVAMPIRLELTGSRGYEDVQAKVIVAEKALLEHGRELGIGTLTCRYRDFGAWCDVFPAASIESEQQMSDFKQALTLALPEQAGVRYHVGERDDWRMPNNRDPREIQFVLRGEDMGTLNELSEDLAAHLAKRLPKGDPDKPEEGGYDTISGPFNEGNQELVVRLDPERLQRLGVRADEVANLVALGFQGVGLGRIRGAEGEVELRLATGSLRLSANDSEGPGLAELEDLRIPITDAAGVRREVPLAAVADIELARSPFWIQRVDRQTEVRMKVRFFSSDREHNKAMLDWGREGFVMPVGYSVGEQTPWGMEQGEMIELAINLGLCLILVYAVMASLFESFLQPAAILVTGLLGCFGAPWAMWASKTTFDLVAMIGLFILIGIIVNNGIMLIDKVTLLRASGMPREQALAQAGRDRLRPVLMTVLTTIFGLVPMLLHHPTLAGVYYHSIAIIIAAGLATSTLMTLVFLPSAYVLVEDFAFESRRVWRWIVRARSA
ncbi:efflux RND transporter permease subunit [Nannocystaceae bacterium ST9]